MRIRSDSFFPPPHCTRSRNKNRNTKHRISRRCHKIFWDHRNVHRLQFCQLVPYRPNLNLKAVVQTMEEYRPRQCTPRRILMMESENPTICSGSIMRCGLNGRSAQNPFARMYLRTYILTLPLVSQSSEFVLVYASNAHPNVFLISSARHAPNVSIK